MPTPAPSLVTVPFQHPRMRALATGQRTALAGLAATLLLAAYPLVKAFIDQGDLSQTAVKTLAFGLAGTLLAAAFAYGQKYLEAKAEPATPAASLTPHEGFVQGTVEAVSLPALPLVDSELLVQLVEKVIRESLAPPAPPATHRAVTPTRAPSGKFATGGTVTTSSGVGEVTQTPPIT